VQGPGTYRPDVDGLRGIAVLAVVVYHAFPYALPGGFVGVDVFFVISGFLITQILRRHLLEHGRLGIGDFYARRVRRLFPALLLVLAFTGLAGWLVMTSGEFSVLGQHLAGAAGFVSNLVLWSESGYFAPDAQTAPLLHLWSLAVEEQFYLAWPLMLLLANRLRAGAVVLVLITLASFVANLVVVERDGSAAFYLPLTRLWELSLGGALAIAGERWAPAAQTARRMGAVGVALLAGSTVLVVDVPSYPGIAAAFPVAGAALCIAAGASAPANRHLLAARWLVQLGLISYPLYLWHWPLLALLRLSSVDPQALSVVAAVALSVALAWLTWRYVERPARSSRSGTVVAGLVAGVAAIGVAGLVVQQGHLAPRHALTGMDKFIDAHRDWAYPPPPAVASTLDLDGLIVHTLGDAAAPGTLFLGDSSAEQYLPRVLRVLPALPDRRVVFVTHGGCLPFPAYGMKGKPECAEFGARASDYAINQAQRIDTVVLAMSLHVALSDERIYSDAGERRLFAGEGTAGAAALLGSLDELIASLQRRNVRVVLIVPQPFNELFHAKKLATRTLFGTHLTQGAQGVRVEDMSRPFRSQVLAVGKRRQAVIVDPEAHICRGGLCETVWNGLPVYKDETHLTARFVRERADYIDAALSGPSRLIGAAD
jgi:peptidoglycan/LPS O-acetylase OafA/YrhL